MSNSNEDVSKDLIDSYFNKTDKRLNKPGLTPKSFYLPNRPGFVDSIRDNYKDYILKTKDDDEDLDSEFTDLFPHQKFVRDYLQDEAPTRGLLLFHGLGVGKTCASIATAELLLNNRNVTVMLPASLKKNYVNEILKCGHKYYTPEKHWRFIPKKTLADLKKIKKLSIIDESVIKKNKGLWYAVEEKEPNYKNLGDSQKEQIMLQVNNIIEKKYNFLHYNGITNKKLNELTDDKKINIFDNNIVIIDEVHNFISRVINGSRIAERLYMDLLEAKNCKLLCLSGTPIINKPYEIGLLINLLKGWTKIYEFSTKDNIDEEQLEKINKLLKDSKYIDNFSYNSLDKVLRVELLPPNFVREDRKSKSMKIKYYLTKTNDDKSRLALILKKLNVDFKFKLNEKIKKFTALPINENKFDKLFINYEKKQLLNEQLFMRRILGTVSFFEYTDSKLFPTIRKNEIIKVDLSDIQLKKYIDVRRDEIRKEKVFNKNNDEEIGQVYKAFSRALCNFTFPDDIERPYPSKLKFLLDDMDNIDDYEVKIQNKVIKNEDNQKVEDNINDDNVNNDEIDPNNKYLKFYSKSKEGKVLSNFADIEVKINGKLYITGEHAFHGQKYLVASETYNDEILTKSDDERKEKLIKYSQLFEGKDTKFKTALDAKRAGGKSGERLSDKEIKIWNSKKSDEIQDKICIYKYKSNKEVRDTLNKFRDHILIHQDNRANDKTPWGARVVNNDGVDVIIGKNKLGKTWTKIYKNEMKETPKNNNNNNNEFNSSLNKFLKDINFKNEAECSSGSYKADFYMKKGDLLNAIKKYPELVKKMPKDFEKLKKPEICKAIYKLTNQTGGVDDKKFKSKNYNLVEYNKLIQDILKKLSDKSDEYLVKELHLYSPKFAKMLELINQTEGSALVYSQFRTVEGIGIFKRVLEANGYAQFKIKKEDGYELDIKEEDYNKPKFMEFTGDKEMTNILLDIFNNNFKNVPEKIREKLDEMHSVSSEKKNGNLRGSIAKVMMITQSGSEGISLKNVRQVHVVEPYWNMIRINQVIGRAARTGSHLALPAKERNIDVFRYLCKFSDEQLKERKIQRMDFGKTTDEIINEGAENKAKITNEFLHLLKRSAVDCFLHKKNHQKLSIDCFSYPVDIDDNELSVKADIFTEDLDKISKNKQKETEISVSIIKIKKKNYIMLENEKDSDTKQLFDYDNYVKFSKLIFVGLLTKNENNKTVLRMKKQEN